MKRALAALSITALVVTAASVPTTNAGSSGTCQVNAYQAKVSEVFNDKRWRERHPVSKSSGRTLKTLKMECASRKARDKMDASYDREREDFLLYQDYRRITPIRGYTDRGRWLTWVPIPRYILDCEGGQWNSHNPSGADGPAQMMPVHGAPDVHSGSSPETKVTYWHYVKRLWDEKGSGPWDCA